MISRRRVKIGEASRRRQRESPDQGSHERRNPKLRVWSKNGRRGGRELEKELTIKGLKRGFGPLPPVL